VIGLSSSGRVSIDKVVEDIFDRIALQFIGNLPSLSAAKRLIVSTQPNLGLANLFVQAMANKSLNDIEKDVLRSLLESSNGYIQTLKNKTRSGVSDKIDTLVRASKIRGDKIDEFAVQAVLDEEFRKAGNSLKTILESESTKLRNLGTAMDVTRVAASIGDSDPTVFFSMVRDSVTCKDCIRLHTVDGVTPSLWKFSQLKASYGKRTDDAPSLLNRHPGCRCSLVYLAKGFGFDKKGKLVYIKENHNAYLDQTRRRS
jgi:hypothetical protein